MALVEVAECDICKSTREVVQHTLLIFEGSAQLRFDFDVAKTAQDVLDRGNTHWFCPKHAKRFRHFVVRGTTPPNPKKEGN